MQVLWSRAAQARSACKCGSCLHAVTKSARRSTTAASRRGVKFGDVVTAFYSTVLATAAVADSQSKDQRTREWDRVIAEARNGKPLHELRPPGFAGRENITEARVSGDDVEDKSLFGDLEICSSWATTAQYTPRETHVEHNLKRLKVRLDDSIGFVKEGGCIGESDDAQMTANELYSQKDLNHLQHRIATLVNKLLTRLQPHQHSPPIVEDGVSKELQDVMAQLRSIRIEVPQLPIYRYKDREAVSHERRELLGSLKTIFKNSAKTEQGMDLLLAKICYNLLVSRTPPSTKTFDLLLDELARLKRHDIVQDVLDTFWKSRLRPTKSTLSIAVRHYTVTRNQEGLTTIQRMIRGIEGGWAITVHDTEQAQYSPVVQAWAMNPKNRVWRSKGKLVSKPSKDNAMFDSLIRANFELRGVRHAIRVIRNAIRESRQIKSDVLIDAIRMCIAQSDFAAGVSLVLAILSPWTNTGKADPFLPIKFEGQIQYFIYQLLSFVGVSVSHGSSGYLIKPLARTSIDGTSSESLSLNSMLPRQALDHLLRHLQFEWICKTTSCLKSGTNNLKTLLNCLKRSPTCTEAQQNRSLERSLERTTHYLNMSQLRIEKATRQTQPRYTILRLQGLEDSLARTEQKTELISSEVQIINAIMRNETKLEDLMDRVTSLGRYHISKERLEHLTHLIWLFARQMMAISLQIDWMALDSDARIRTRYILNSWRRRLLVNIDRRIEYVVKNYTIFDAVERHTVREAATPPALDFQARPWLIDPLTSRWKSINLSLTESEVEVAPEHANPAPHNEFLPMSSPSAISEHHPQPLDRPKARHQLRANVTSSQPRTQDAEVHGRRSEAKRVPHPKSHLQQRPILSVPVSVPALSFFQAEKQSASSAYGSSFA